MSRYEHGRVLAVNETTLGSELVGDHAAGVSSLTVEDPVDFDEDGGWLSINGQVVEYSTYDDDTGEITLRGTLDAAAGEGDRVDLWDELRQVVTVDKIAQVELDGDDDNTDPLEAVIPLHLLDDLAEGIRGLRGESVLLEQDGDEWRIVDVLGMAAQGASGTQFKREELFTLTDAGPQALTLTRDPIAESVQVRINGVDYHPTDGWSRTGQTLTLLAPLPRADDQVSVQYAYHAGPIYEPVSTIVAFGATGWSYKQVASTDSSDYSTAGFDDSAWSVGQAPFGSSGSAVSNPLPVNTTWDGETRLWLRRDLPPATSVAVHVKVEDNCTVYVNGNLVGSSPVIGTGGNTDPGVEFTVDDAFLDPAGNVLAIRCDDEYEGISTSEVVYVDVEVRGRLL